jgi:RHS repeat-associated protein
MLAGSDVGRHSLAPLYGIYAYTAREWDPESNLYYYRARYYDPKLGRFVGEDPAGLRGGIDLYTYVGNNPVVYFDADGREPSRDRLYGVAKWVTRKYWEPTTTTNSEYGGWIYYNPATDRYSNDSWSGGQDSLTIPAPTGPPAAIWHTHPPDPPGTPPERRHDDCWVMRAGDCDMCHACEYHVPIFMRCRLGLKVWMPNKPDCCRLKREERCKKCGGSL